MKSHQNLVNICNNPSITNLCFNFFEDYDKFTCTNVFSKNKEITDINAIDFKFFTATEDSIA